MRNIRLTLAYDGTNYVGWQIQPNGPSIQAAVKSAIEKLTGETANVLAAGRTDSGVHALGQVANFCTESFIPCEKIRTGLQRFLPEDIIIREASEVDESFHATYSAKQKRYRYVILNSRMVLPFLRNYVYHHHRELDAAVMQQAADRLIGTHDFRSFESQFPNKACSVRTVMEVTVGRCSIWPVWSEPIQQRQETELTNCRGDYIRFDIVADGFLYNMVRAIVGTLLKVGEGKWTPDDVRRIIDQQDRSQAGETVPPGGLYLVHVDY
jgi:tRNA pseudouridine38-40 synthase